ncbi:MAG: hypothetical protein IKM81_10740 [Fibrobacter sp.]|nr:hypothetical protein [Fibrobacter sp.]
MALNKTTLKNALKAVFESRPSSDEDAADALATAIYDFVKSAEVTITALPNEVSVVGSPTAQANAVPLTLKGGDATHTGGLS